MGKAEPPGDVRESFQETNRAAIPEMALIIYKNKTAFVSLKPMIINR